MFLIIVDLGAAGEYAAFSPVSMACGSLPFSFRFFRFAWSELLILTRITASGCDICSYDTNNY